MRRGPYLATILILAAASAATATATAQAPKNPAGLSGGSPGRSPGGDTVKLDFPEDRSREAEEAKAFQRLRVPGRDVSKAVRKIRRLKWHSSLTPASLRAKRENKPIVWIQALGSLKGYT